MNRPNLDAEGLDAQGCPDPYDEDGYCDFCGNGRWKFHGIDCEWANRTEQREREVMSESEFTEGVIIRGGTWRRRYCWRNEHDLIVTLTVDLTLQAVCLRCRAAGEITGLAVMFTATPNPEATT